MKRFILFAFVFALGCHGSCPKGQKKSNGVCCDIYGYYHTRALKCRSCACNQYGAKGGKKGKCNKYGACYCYDGFKGYSCEKCEDYNKKISNGRCCEKDHFYSLIDQRCKACECDEFGAVGGRKGECGEQGWCNCINGRHTGPNCDKCWPSFKMSNGRCCKKHQYYNIHYNKCRDCRCTELGSKGGIGGECDEDGNCYCYFQYTGAECQNCNEGYKMSNNHCCRKDHYYDIWKKECTFCRCNEFGAVGGLWGECGEYGYCDCHEHYTGQQCQECESNAIRSNDRCCRNDHYYATWDNKCRYCRCEEPGSKGGKGGGCNEDGYCYCYDGYTGSECQDCKAGWKKWGFLPGCIPNMLG